MATGLLISVESYLKTSYRPDRDYIDGEVVERNVGERKHGRLQIRIGAWFLARESQWNIKTFTELRVRVSDNRYRIPDVVVLSADAPDEPVVITPPRLCIEVLSPCDSLNQIWDRTQDYFAIGVPVCWIVDPESRRGWTVTPTGLVEAKDGIVRADELVMPLAEVLE